MQSLIDHVSIRYFTVIATKWTYDSTVSTKQVNCSIIATISGSKEFTVCYIARDFCSIREVPMSKKSCMWSKSI